VTASSKLTNAPVIYFQSSTQYLVQNLVSDVPGPAPVTDPNLVNPWGFAAGPTTDWWISNSGSVTITVFNSTNQTSAATIIVPSLGQGSTTATVSNTAPRAQGSPTGVVFNGGTGFVAKGGGNQPAPFLFASQDGAIAAFNGASIVIV